MTDLVYRDAIASTPIDIVYDNAILTGTTTNLTLTTTQNSVGTLTSLVPTGSKILIVQQVSQVTLSKQTPHTLSVTQTSTNEVTTATNLLGAVTTVGNAGIASLDNTDGDVRSANQVSVASLTMTIIPGGSSSTFFKTLNTTQNSVATNSKAIQTVKSALQRSVATIRIGSYILQVSQRSQAVLIIDSAHSSVHPFLPVGNPGVASLSMIVIVATPSGVSNPGHQGGSGGHGHGRHRPGVAGGKVDLTDIFAELERRVDKGKLLEKNINGVPEGLIAALANVPDKEEEKKKEQKTMLDIEDEAAAKLFSKFIL